MLEIKREDRQYVQFEKLQTGDLFEYENDIFIKVYIFNLSEEEGNISRACLLTDKSNNGDVFEFKENTIVAKLAKATLTVG